MGAKEERVSVVFMEVHCNDRDSALHPPTLGEVGDPLLCDTSTTDASKYI